MANLYGNGRPLTDGGAIPLPVQDGHILVGNASGGFDYQPLSSVVEGITTFWADPGALPGGFPNDSGHKDGELGVLRSTGDVYRFDDPDDDGVGVWTLKFNLQDGAPVGPNTKIEIVQFAFNDGSPKTIATMSAGQAVIDSEVVITDIFDDVAATLALGTSGTPSALLGTGDIDPTSLDTNGSDTNITFSGADTIVLTITPGASTKGSGYVVLLLKV